MSREREEEEGRVRALTFEAPAGNLAVGCGSLGLFYKA